MLIENTIGIGIEMSVFNERWPFTQKCPLFRLHTKV